METLNAYRSIRTVSGVYINVFDPDPDTIRIEDIAHSLSFQPRFGGHLPEFFSVAQHSIMCCLDAPIGLKLEALMHDASEAYLLDMPRPIKIEMPEYKKIENNLMEAIAKKFCIRYPFHPTIKELDNVALEREWYDLMLDTPQAWHPRIKCMTPKEAKESFMTLFIMCQCFAQAAA